ncbi:MAG: hypothetical protein AAGL90_16325 [Pseudomonadota bacterium]
MKKSFLSACLLAASLTTAPIASATSIGETNARAGVSVELKQRSATRCQIRLINRSGKNLYVKKATIAGKNASVNRFNTAQGGKTITPKNLGSLSGTQVSMMPATLFATTSDVPSSVCTNFSEGKRTWVDFRGDLCGTEETGPNEVVRCKTVIIKGNLRSID